MKSGSRRLSVPADLGSRTSGVRRRSRGVAEAGNANATPVGINIGIGAGFVLAAAVVAALIPVRDTGWRFAVVAVAVGWSAVVCVDHVALAPVALLGWLVVNGFLVDRFGELSWHGSSDLYRMMLLVMVGALGLAVGEARHQLFQLRTRWRTEAEWQALVAHIKEEEKRDA